MGKLSQAVAPGSDKTWKALTDEAKRPRTAREGVDQELMDVNPTILVDLDVDLMLKNLRTSRRGAAAGPSGMATEHLKILLDNTECCALFGEVATLFVRGQIPPEILEGVRVGRMTALQKPDGRVREIVVGDVMRRLMARILAQQFGPQAEAATHPFQHALSTRVGTECVAHVVQAFTSLDKGATILSIHGVGAYDTISRKAMLRGVADMVDGDKLIPFVRQFHSCPSTFLWEDEVGETRRIPAGRRRFRCRLICERGKDCSLSLTTSTLCAPLREWEPCASRWSTHCEEKSASASVECRRTKCCRCPCCSCTEGAAIEARSENPWCPSRTPRVRCEGENSLCF